MRESDIARTSRANNLREQFGAIQKDIRDLKSQVEQVLLSHTFDNVILQIKDKVVEHMSQNSRNSHVSFASDLTSYTAFHDTEQSNTSIHSSLEPLATAQKPPMLPRNSSSISSRALSADVFLLKHMDPVFDDVVDEKQLEQQRIDVVQKLKAAKMLNETTEAEIQKLFTAVKQLLVGEEFASSQSVPELNSQQRSDCMLNYIRSNYNKQSQVRSAVDSLIKKYQD